MAKNLQEVRNGFADRLAKLRGHREEARLRRDNAVQAFECYQAAISELTDVVAELDAQLECDAKAAASCDPPPLEATDP